MANIQNLKKRSKELAESPLIEENDLDSVISNEVRSQQAEDFVGSTHDAMSSLIKTQSIPDVSPEPAKDNTFNDLDFSDEEPITKKFVRPVFPDDEEETDDELDSENVEHQEALDLPEAPEEIPLIDTSLFKEAPSPVEQIDKTPSPVDIPEEESAPATVKRGPKPKSSLSTVATSRKLSDNDDSELWGFNTIAEQMITEARNTIKLNGIDSDLYWDRILEIVQDN